MTANIILVVTCYLDLHSRVGPGIPQLIQSYLGSPLARLLRSPRPAAAVSPAEARGRGGGGGGGVALPPGAGLAHPRVPPHHGVEGVEGPEHVPDRDAGIRTVSLHLPEGSLLLCIVQRIADS